MKVPHVRRRWVVLIIVAIVALGTIRLLDQPLALDSYRAVDPQTLVVTGYGAKTAWTHITSVVETEATISISVNSLEYTGFLPHSDSADRIEVEVPLGSPLGGRSVIDGNTGLPVPAAD